VPVVPSGGAVRSRQEGAQMTYGGQQDHHLGDQEEQPGTPYKRRSLQTVLEACSESP
jgi:hypothetical protein